MADPKHLDLLRQGVEFWNAWREEAIGTTPDLSAAILNEMYLYEANLRGVNLHGADLREANLSWANLNGADLRETKLCRAIFCETDFSGATLVDVDMSEFDYHGAIHYPARSG